MLKAMVMVRIRVGYWPSNTLATCLNEYGSIFEKFVKSAVLLFTSAYSSSILYWKQI